MGFLFLNVAIINNRDIYEKFNTHENYDTLTMAMSKNQYDKVVVRSNVSLCRK